MSALNRKEHSGEGKPSPWVQGVLCQVGTEGYRENLEATKVAVLGHKDINTTRKHYAAISEDIKRAASKVVVLRNKDGNPST